MFSGLDVVTALFMMSDSSKQRRIQTKVNVDCELQGSLSLLTESTLDVVSTDGEMVMNDCALPSLEQTLAVMDIVSALKEKGSTHTAGDGECHEQPLSEIF